MPSRQRVKREWASWPGPRRLAHARLLANDIFCGDFAGPSGGRSAAPRWRPLGTEIDATTAGLDHVIEIGLTTAIANRRMDPAGRRLPISIAMPPATGHSVWHYAISRSSAGPEMSGKVVFFPLAMRIYFRSAAQ